MEPIVRKEPEGATIAYLDARWQPTSPELATLVKIVYDDGRVVFAAPQRRRT